MISPIFKPAEVSDEADVEHSLSAAAFLADDDMAQQSAVLVHRKILTVDEQHSFTVGFVRA